MKHRFVIARRVGVVALALMIGLVTLAVASVKESLPGQRPQASSPKQTQVKPIVVYKSPTCTCCAAWIDHARGAGFQVEARDVSHADLTAMLRQSGVPDSLHSCHAAYVSGYVVVGHVPAQTIRLLLLQHPAGVVGIAVAGMPIGSPGMEAAGEAAHYNVMALRRTGHPYVYERH